MRVLLVISVAVIGLFTGQSSLFATLVYRYEWTYHVNTAPTPQGDPFSGYIDFLTPTNEIGVGIEGIYDLQFTSYPTTDPSRPLIPATTFSLSDVSAFSGLITWNGQTVGGIWNMQFNFFQQMSLFCSIDSASLNSFYPLEYVFNEASMSGNWKFTGKKNVPDSGGTMSILILSGLALGGFSLATRVTCKAAQSLKEAKLMTVAGVGAWGAGQPAGLLPSARCQSIEQQSVSHLV